MFKNMVNIKQKRPIIEILLAIFKMVPQDNDFVCTCRGEVSLLSMCPTMNSKDRLTDLQIRSFHVWLLETTHLASPGLPISELEKLQIFVLLISFP